MKIGQGHPLGLAFRLGALRARPKREVGCLTLFPLTRGLGIDIEGVVDVGHQITVDAPTKELPTALRERGSHGGIGKPLHIGENDCGVRPPAVDNVDQINVEVELQIGQEPFPELVNQLAEAEASPTAAPLV